MTRAAPAPAEALSVLQPWAHGLVTGAKPVENRTWAPAWLCASQPRWLLIAASARWPRMSAEEEAHLRSLWPGLPERGEAPTGAIVGACRFIAVVAPTSPCLPRGAALWASGPKCWVVSNSVVFPEAVPAKGRLGLWTPTAAVQVLVREQWARRVVTRGVE